MDAARDLRRLRPVRATVAEAVQRGFTDLDSLDAEIRRARRSRTALIRKAFAEITDGVRSAPETELRECLGGSSVLGGILWNPRLSAADGTRLPTPDGYLADCAVALEVDSREYHLSPNDWARTLDQSPGSSGGPAAAGSAGAPEGPSSALATPPPTIAPPAAAPPAMASSSRRVTMASMVSRPRHHEQPVPHG